MIQRITATLSSLLILTGCNTSFFKVVSSSYAKEYCSCRFVVGQDKQYCHNYALQIIPVASYKEDLTKKTIKASAIGFSSQASYISSRLGCKLIN